MRNSDKWACNLSNIHILTRVQPLWWLSYCNFATVTLTQNSAFVETCTSSESCCWMWMQANIRYCAYRWKQYTWTPTREKQFSHLFDKRQGIVLASGASIALFCRNDFCTCLFTSLWSLRSLPLKISCMYIQFQISIKHFKRNQIGFNYFSMSLFNCSLVNFPTLLTIILLLKGPPI